VQELVDDLSLLVVEAQCNLVDLLEDHHICLPKAKQRLSSIINALYYCDPDVFAYAYRFHNGAAFFIPKFEVLPVFDVINSSRKTLGLFFSI